MYYKKHGINDRLVGGMGFNLHKYKDKINQRNVILPFPRTRRYVKRFCVVYTNE